MSRVKEARVYGGGTDRIERYLPGNYRVTGLGVDEYGHGFATIRGTDDHGWTMDAYVIPRLGSGAMRVEVVDG